MRRAVWLSSLLIVTALVSSPAMAQTQPQQQDKDYIIGPEDVLDIQVWGSKELNQVVFVRPDGRLPSPWSVRSQWTARPSSSFRTTCRACMSLP